MACLHLAKFNGHRYCGSRDILFLVRHVIKQDHKELLNVSHHSAKFGGHSHCSSGDKWF